MRQLACESLATLVLVACVVFLLTPGQASATVSLQVQLNLESAVTQGCRVADASLGFDLTESFDALLVSTDFKWRSLDPEQVECLGSEIEVVLDFEALNGERYLMPLILRVGSGDGQVMSSAVSPRWDRILCWSVSPVQRCVSADQSKKLLAEEGRISAFKVERIVSQPNNAPIVERGAIQSLSGVSEDMEAVLKDSIDSALGLRSAKGSLPETELGRTEGPRRESLIGQNLAMYQPPSTACERDLRVAYSVLQQSQCVLEIKSVTRFEPQCGDQRQPVQNMSRATLDLTLNPMDEVSLISLPEGAALLSISLDGAWVDHENHLSNQWLLSAEEAHFAELEALALQLAEQQARCVSQ